MFILFICTGLSIGKNVEAILSALFKSGIVQPGGLLTSLAEGTEQQWDSPNAWAPLVLLTIEGLSTIDIPAGSALAVSRILRYFCRVCSHDN